jgi:Domain of unknown function DUF29
MEAMYEHDFAAWAHEQSKALAERRFEDLDLSHLVEEVEDLGGSERDQLESRIVILMAHLLKWKFQPEARSGNWRGSITEQRQRLRKLLKKNPSLKPSVEDVTIESYDDAIEIAMAETNLSRETFPAECPYQFEDLFSIEVQ